MESEWPLVHLGEVCHIYDGPHATPKKTPTGPVFMSIASLRRGRLDLGFSAHLSESDFERWTRRVQPQQGDLVFSYETRLGEAALVPSGLRCALGRRMGLLRPNPDRVDPRYLLYYWLGPEFQEVIRERTVHGSTVDRILLTELGEYPIRLPGLVEQQAIAEVLGALDDKIDANTRQQATLRRLSSLMFSGLHDVPWEQVRLGDYVEVVKGRSYRRDDLDPASTTALVTLKSIARGGGYQTSGLKPYTGTYRQEQVVQPGEVVVAHTDVTQAAEVVGRPARVPAEEGYEALVASLDVAVVRSRSDEVSDEFLYELLATPSFANHAISHTNGTTVLHLDKRAVADFEFALPPIDRVARFTESVRPLWQRHDLLNMESRTLERMRDTLLPKLVSGELRIADAEALVGEAA